METEWIECLSSKGFLKNSNSQCGGVMNWVHELGYEDRTSMKGIYALVRMKKIELSLALSGSL